MPTFSFDASLPGDIDGLGRLVSGSETLIGASGSSVTHDLSYSYDGMGQLLSASVSNIGGSSWSIAYNYGKDGNIQSMTLGGETVNFEYDSDDDGNDDSDLMTKIGDDSLGWNLNGNLDNSVNASFTYDFDNKLRFATADSNSIEIRYDPRGNRIYKAITDPNGDIVKERKYIVDIVGRLPVILCEIDPNNSSLTNKYYYANSQILAQDSADPNERYFYLHDRLGSVRQVVDCNALTVATYTYNPYGEDFASDCNDVGIYNPFKYTGQWYDAEISQYYLRARQYDPQLMRFTGRDSALGNYQMPMSLHRYLYCWNNSTNLVDLTGETPWFAQYEFWSEIGNELVKGAAAAADGFNPIPCWNPFEDVYANADGSVDAVYKGSRVLGSASRTMVSMALNTYVINKMVGDVGLTINLGERLLISALWKGMLVENTLGQAASLTVGTASALLDVMGAGDTIFDAMDAVGYD